ncbi:hypothetical protein AZ78_2228 [Lysobacter capsici AZ78]|uniref:Uncharacterized protein n=1 Tax=Lysobacter capsici AZ78 TaxID=1444315 RepID=A0A108U8U8_9GAMM|nr:hypothetical protein AZ78_2228 [Lysobacter capsici AZ78]
MHVHRDAPVNGAARAARTSQAAASTARDRRTPPAATSTHPRGPYFNDNLFIAPSRSTGQVRWAIEHHAPGLAASPQGSKMLVGAGTDVFLLGSPSPDEQAAAQPRSAANGESLDPGELPDLTDAVVEAACVAPSSADA